MTFQRLRVILAVTMGISPLPRRSGFVPFTFGSCKGCFVYVLIRGTEIVYVGQTTRLDQRIKEHRNRQRQDWDFEFDRVVIKRCRSTAAAKRSEGFLIRLFEPEYNHVGVRKAEIDLMAVLGVG